VRRTPDGTHLSMARRQQPTKNGRTGRGSARRGGALPAGLPALVEGWFAGAARDLPWRRARSGYHALVSELMLQQTQVARVVERFGPFIARFPSAATLAEASEDAVLAAWQGLGYYRRARFLHAAAKAVVDRHGGEVPAGDHAALLALPGVGRYTAGAIASIVAGAAVPIVDGNVTRVFQRVAAREGSASDREVVDWAWREAERFVERAVDPAAANDGRRELGATVCTPAAPRCGGCPLARVCAARAAGRVEEIPAPKARVARRELVLVTARLVRASDDAVLLEQRPREGLWGGLWQPPAVECADGREMSARAAAELLGLPATVALRASGEVPFQTTHRAVVFVVYEAKVRGAGAAFARGGRRWVGRDALGEFALSNAAKRVLGA
jgi:A/G-specific adenine glycosylase